MARGRITAFATDETLDELRALVSLRGYRSRHSPHNGLRWYYDKVRRVEPAPIGKSRSRDPAHDPYLACALAADAKIIVSRDEDLLSLQKPFGIAIITPRELLRRRARQ